MKKAIFLDKDGTLVEDVPYNVDPSLIRFAPHAVRALRQLQDYGFMLVVITNQSGVGLGYFSEEKVQEVHKSLSDMLTEQQVHLKAFYYCPHAPNGEGKPECECRKPEAGMLLKAAKELGIHLPSSWMIGDILNDVEAGHRAGCKAILVDNGNETEWETGELRNPDYLVKDLKEAADIICIEEIVS